MATDATKLLPLNSPFRNGEMHRENILESLNKNIMTEPVITFNISPVYNRILVDL